MIRTASFVLFGCLTALLRGQELLWEVHSVTGVRHDGVYPDFGDYDGDGTDDLLVAGRDYRPGYPLGIFRVLSGLSGSLLAELHPPYSSAGGYGNARGAGDFDGDGHPDVAFFAGSSTTGGWFDVWSIATGTRLLQIPGVVGGAYGGAHSCRLDVTGDGLADVVFVQGDATIRVHDHSGALLYTIPAVSMGFIPVDIAVVGDLDGDGCDDYVVGAFEYITGFGLGAVVLISGKSGTPLRIHWGPQPYTFLNKDVRAAGDVDGDGVMDYAAGNYGSPIARVMIWSGATGNLIRQWVENDPRYFGGLFLAGLDVDLDGRADILVMAGGYPNTPGQVADQGRVRTLSTRDGQDLVHVASTQWTTAFAETYANLGVQPGNPYPVFATVDDPVVPPYNNWRRIRVYRCSPQGTSFVGAGCTTTGVQPTIGVRRVDAQPTDHGRLLLGSAPPNALAVLVVAPSTASLPAPVALDFLGLPGCDLLVTPAILEQRITGAAGMDRGYAAVDFPAAMAATGGVKFAAQWV
ncbi:MAG: VCBS repeat-containing protein, partial [Planctomycetes bacterium]|nr:VCBS repeat-containing protein [Planctomycetota bacterium]